MLYRAASSTFGIVVETNHPLLLQQRLAQARAKLQDPGLDNLSFRRSPDNFDSELYIVKTGKVTVPASAPVVESEDLDRMIDEITQEVTSER